jgi:hypothetical protein
MHFICKSIYKLRRRHQPAAPKLHFRRGNQRIDRKIDFIVFLVKSIITVNETLDKSKLLKRELDLIFMLQCTN